MRRTLLSMAIASALAGCASEPKIIFKTVEVRVPGLPVLCKIDRIARPAFALDGAKVAHKLYSKGAAAMAEIQQRKAYETKLEAAVEACQ